METSFLPVPSDTIVRVLMKRRAELIGYAWVVVGDAELAEDVFQEVSVAAIRKGDEIIDAEHLVGWLYKAVRLEGLKARRGRGPKLVLLSDQALEAIEQANAAAASSMASDHLDALRECIGRLQGMPRQVLEMRYGQNLKPAQIAEDTGRKVETIYKIITRAHSALRDCVKQRLSLDGGPA